MKQHPAADQWVIVAPGCLADCHLFVGLDGQPARTARHTKQGVTKQPASYVIQSASKVQVSPRNRRFRAI